MRDESRCSGGVLLSEWLRRSHISKSTFAAEMGWTRPQLSQYLHGQRRPSLEILIRIAERTGIPIVAWVERRVAKMERAEERLKDNAKVHNTLTARRVS